MKEKALIKETGQILDIKENWMKSYVNYSFSFDDLETKEFIPKSDRKRAAKSRAAYINKKYRTDD